MSGADDALKQRVQELARELGFVRSGIARAEPMGADSERLRAWLDAGYHGGMDYMERTSAVRADPTHPGMLASARSVVVVAAAYGGSRAPGAVARYARGRDYHNVLHKKLKPIVKLLRAEGHEARAAVDSMPVMERALAQRAGIGFIGKNCCLIIPGVGSHVFLAAIVTSAELAADEPMRERCGQCRLCLDACPTNAFVAARVMDARRCIAYLTIEHRGAIDEALRPLVGERLFGCDSCQDVCPWNRAAPDEPVMAPFAAEAERALDEPEALLQLSEDAFEHLTNGTPLRRTRREGLCRNAAIALGNRRSSRALPVLRASAEGDASEVVRDAARWAIARVERDPSEQE
jgi:epoxyqueuosine reductase